MAYFIILTPFSTTAEQQLLINPEEIKIAVSEKELDKVRNTTIYLSPIQNNLSNVKVLSTDLKSDQENWIESLKIKVKPNTINLLTGHVSNLTLNFEGLDSKPGIYSGNLLLTSRDLTIIKIPLTVTIHSDAKIALVLVGLGVVTSFIFKFFQLKVKDKGGSENYLDSLISKRNEVAQLKMNRKDETHQDYNNSLTQIADINIDCAITEYNNGNFHESIKTAKESSDYLGKVMLQPQLPPLKPSIQVQDKKLKLFWFLTGPKRGDYVAFAGLTLGLLISVLLVWQEYFSKLSVFGIFPIDYISAFLFGFGSQAILLSEILDFAKRIND